MTELSNTPPTPINDNTDPKGSSPWVTLISMLLLISALVLSSVMLMHYAMDGKEGEEGKRAFAFTELMEKGKALSARPTSKTEQPQIEQPQIEQEPAEKNTDPVESGFKRFFSGDHQAEVRWPKLKLTGFGKGSEGQSDFAIINGEQVLLGSPIDGVMLVEILNQGVVVEYKGEQKTLTVKLKR